MLTILNYNTMFKRVFILFCFSLIFISISYSQLPNKVKVVVRNDGSDDLRYRCGTYDENIKELRLNFEMSTPFYGFAFMTYRELSTGSEIDAIVPLDMSGISMNGLNQIELALNLESELILPDGLYEIHVLANEESISNISDDTLIYLFNKQSD